MITLQKITKKIGARTLFEEVSATFSSGNCYGLTGPNGAGKSTLLKIMMGVEPPTSGTVSLPKKVGFLRQNLAEFAEIEVLDTVIMGNSRLWAAMQERERLYGEEMTDAVGMRLGTLEEIVAEEDGYSAESEAEVLLAGVGIPESHYKQPLKMLPTDSQFKVLLCQALFGQPDALLLDEPTNHLDLDSIGWLQDFLRSYKGTMIVVSHDRYFLNAVTSHIADIDYDTLIIYPGNYDSMLVAKTAVRERTELENKSKEKKVSQLREFVARFGAGTRASQVQSRIREIERLEPQELKKSNIQRPYVRFYPPEQLSGQSVWRTKGLTKGYDGNPVIQNFSYEVSRGDKIGVIGSNGRGKSTLLKLLAGVIASDGGKLEVGHKVEVGYFPQNHEECVDKKSDTTLFDWLKSARPDVYDQDIRSILGKMLFPGEDAFKKIATLSGGETARMILGKMMLQKHNTLILDEPNNHLDLEAVSALSWAIQEFKGTVIVASHDRDLLSKTATRIIALEADRIHCYEGPLEEYLEVQKAATKKR